jgi:hypothetical protein
MSASTKLVDKLEGVENFHAYKYRIGIILEENDLAKFFKGEILELDDVAKKKKSQASKGHNQGQKNHCRFNQRPSDSLCVI